MKLHHILFLSFFQQHNEIPPPKKVNSVPNILLKALTNTGTYSDKS